MNPERRIKWIDKVTGFLTRCHLFVENLFPKKEIEIIDLSDMDKKFVQEWTQTIRDMINGSN